MAERENVNLDIFESHSPYLWNIPDAARALAIAHLTQRNALGLSELAAPETRLNVVAMPSDLLRHLGLFDEAWWPAYTMSERSTHHRTHHELRSLFALANRPR